MNLLLITQKIDINDHVLGFFHSWVKKFSQNFSSVIAVCLQKGEYSLPANVKVLSLGKETGISSLKYIFNFYRFIIKEKSNYDAVFIHMNPVYAILGWPVWMLFGKKYLLWYNHPEGNLLACMAIKMADDVFCTSPFAFANQYKKTLLMPAGIDTILFKKESPKEKIKGSILYLGRISPIKKIECLIEAAKILDEKNTDFTLHIIGSPMVKEDIEYEEMLKSSARELAEKGKVKFLPKVVNLETPAIYNQNEVFVNLTPTGSFDKTVLEAMACETMVLVSNKSFGESLPAEFIFKEDDAKDLAEKLCFILNLPEEIKNQYGENLRRDVTEKHSLDKLMSKLKQVDCSGG